MKRRDFFKIAIGGAAAAVLLPEVVLAEPPTWYVSQIPGPSPLPSMVELQDQLNRYHEEALRHLATSIEKYHLTDSMK